MNHDELGELISKLKRVSVQLDDEINQLQGLHRIRQASRNTGRRSTTTSGHAASNNNGNSRGNGTETDTDGRKYNGNNDRRLKVGDSVEVTRGKHQGAKATIIRETVSQFELKSERIIGTFRKWKTNVRKIKNQV